MDETIFKLYSDEIKKIENQNNIKFSNCYDDYYNEIVDIIINKKITDINECSDNIMLDIHGLYNQYKTKDYNLMKKILFTCY